MKLLDLQDWFESIEIFNLIRDGIVSELIVKLNNKIYKITPCNCFDYTFYDKFSGCKLYNHLDTSKLPATFGDLCHKCNEYEKRKYKSHCFKYCNSIKEGV